MQHHDFNVEQWEQLPRDTPHFYWASQASLQNQWEVSLVLVVLFCKPQQEEFLHLHMMQKCTNFTVRIGFMPTWKTKTNTSAAVTNTINYSHQLCNFPSIKKLHDSVDFDLFCCWRDVSRGSLGSYWWRLFRTMCIRLWAFFEHNSSSNTIFLYPLSKIIY